jgi:DNA polymerase-3 subunit alpha
MKFVSLHSHTTYSYGDGFGMPDEHVKRIADLGMSALAVTEHGNTSSHVKLEQAALAAGVKPVFGLEAYTGPPNSMRKWHMTILAADQEGYGNLTQLTTRSWKEGFYRWPTVHWDMLEEHHTGLIVTSGCADSHLACTLLGGKGIEQGDEREARRLMLKYRDLFGDRYYLETQRFPQLDRCKELNEKYEEWSRKYKIPLVGTADVHYPYQSQNGLQQALHAANRGHAVGDSDWNYDVRLTYPTSDKEMIADLRETGLSKRGAEQGIASSAEIAERCNVTLPKMDRLRYPITKKDYEPWPLPKQKSFSDTGANKAGSTGPSTKKRRRTRTVTASS